MSVKTSHARREAFFAALSATGNQTLAAERARVSRSWVHLHQSTDPAFRARMEACIAEARVAIRAAGSTAPPKGWGHQDGEELVVRGTRGRRAQVARARLNQWTASVERDFLRALAASANVRHACRTVGLSVPSAYVHRSKYRKFAENWDEAVDIGETRLEMALFENATNVLEGVAVDPDGSMPPMTVMEAIVLLRSHSKAAREKHRNKRWWWRHPRPIEEVRESILRKLEAMRRHEELKTREPPEWLA